MTSLYNVVYSVTSSKLGVKLPLFWVYCENNKLLKHLLNKIQYAIHDSDHYIFEEMTYVFVSCNLGLLTSRQVALNKKIKQYSISNKMECDDFCYTN